MTEQQTKILNRCKELAGGLRHESFGMAIEWILNNTKPKSVLIETGRFRGNGAEGQSTLILAILAKETGASFISIDDNQETFAQSKELLIKNDVEQYATLLNADSTGTITNLAGNVSFCYLDSARSPQLELGEATALVAKMTTPAAILIDDCGEGGGKSVLSVPFLESRGWKLKHSQFQRFLTLG